MRRARILGQPWRVAAIGETVKTGELLKTLPGLGVAEGITVSRPVPPSIRPYPPLSTPALASTVRLLGQLLSPLYLSRGQGKTLIPIMALAACLVPGTRLHDFLVVSLPFYLHRCFRSRDVPLIYPNDPDSSPEREPTKSLARSPVGLRVYFLKEGHHAVGGLEASFPADEISDSSRRSND